jgi:hypothetical protein
MGVGDPYHDRSAQVCHYKMDAFQSSEGKYGFTHGKAISDGLQ